VRARACSQQFQKQAFLTAFWDSVSEVGFWYGAVEIDRKHAAIRVIFTGDAADAIPACSGFRGSSVDFVTELGADIPADTVLTPEVLAEYWAKSRYAVADVPRLILDDLRCVHQIVLKNLGEVGWTEPMPWIGCESRRRVGQRLNYFR